MKTVQQLVDSYHAGLSLLLVETTERTRLLRLVREAMRRMDEEPTEA